MDPVLVRGEALPRDHRRGARDARRPHLHDTAPVLSALPLQRRQGGNRALPGSLPRRDRDGDRLHVLLPGHPPGLERGQVPLADGPARARSVLRGRAPHTVRAGVHGLRRGRPPCIHRLPLGVQRLRPVVVGAGALDVALSCDLRSEDQEEDDELEVRICGLGGGVLRDEASAGLLLLVAVVEGLARAVRAWPKRRRVGA
mmetsp:Transcript_18448/g.37603  ORF Transcript_18448/g.37603 Transcript_18448/m.37603 type:complete len:200 (+) Transcript_18448:104-703(+)